MRPIRLQIAAFGPYHGTVDLDFTRLGAAELFLIHGPTGAGKTTILDAMVYALYGSASSEVRGVSTLRSQYADPTLPTQVIFTFSIGEEFYRITRSPQQEVMKKRGTGTKSMAAQCQVERYQRACDAWDMIPGKSREMEAYIKSLLGFTKEEFRQVVLLPQGEFRKVLLGSSQERASLLSRLFQTGIYDRFQEVLKERADVLAQACADKIRIEEEVLREEDVTTLEALRDKCQAHQLFCQEAETQLALEERTLAEVVVKINAFQQWQAAEEAWQDYRQQVVMLEEELVRSEAIAQEIAVLDAYATWRPDWRERQKLYEEMRSWEAKGAEATQCLQEIQRDRIRLQGELKQWEQAMIAPDMIAEAKAKVQRLSEYEAAKAKWEDMERAIIEHDLKLEKYKTSSETKRQQWETMQGILAKNQAFALRQSLQDGEPCPVCGSCIHPAPASDPDFSVEKDVVSQLESEFQEASLQYAAAMSAQEQRRQQLEETRESLQTQYGEMPTQSLAEVEAEYQGIQEQSQAHMALGKILHEREQVLVRRESQYQTELDQSQRQGKMLLESLTKVEARLAEVLTEYTAEDVFALETQYGRLPGLRAQWQNLQKRKDQLDGERVVRQEARERAAAGAIYVSESEALAAERTRLEQQVRDGRQSLGMQKQRWQELAGKIAKVEKAKGENTLIEKQYQLVQRLHDIASGKSDGVRRFTFKNYVLRALLQEVLVAANLRLKVMSRNRYTLETAALQDTSRGQQGLDLAVFDTYTGQSRPVHSLSGGETFLASLALSLGLADIVQSYAGGIHLESMFIDEGFGTLDEETLDIAMEALLQLQRGGRLVGIISHVGALKERLAARLVITKTDKGSQARFEVADVPCL